METEDVINLSEWETADDAVTRLASAGIQVSLPQLYQRGAASALPRKRIAITSRLIFGRVVLLRADVDRYGAALLAKRIKKSERSTS